MDKNRLDDPVAYVEYMLKNYHSLKRDLEQMKLELSYCQLEKEEDTISAMVFGEDTGCGKRTVVGGTDNTAAVALLYQNVNQRINEESRHNLKRYIAAGELELKKLDMAIESLPEEQKKVITDLYISRLKWEQVAMRRYISANTINRYRKKAMVEMAHAFTGERKWA